MIKDFQSLGVEEPNFDFTIPTFLYNERIMTHLSMKLRQTNTKLDLGPHRSVAGSRANIVLVDRSTDSPANTSRMYIEDILRASTASMMNSKVITAGQTFAYRLRREADDSGVPHGHATALISSK